jgi:hypothetical protein
MAYAAGRVAPLAYLRPDLPGRLIAAVRRAMADEPHRRQASVDEFCAELCGGRSPVRRIAL